MEVFEVFGDILLAAGTDARSTSLLDGITRLSSANVALMLSSSESLADAEDLKL